MWEGFTEKMTFKQRCEGEVVVWREEPSGWMKWPAPKPSVDTRLTRRRAERSGSLEVSKNRGGESGWHGAQATRALQDAPRWVGGEGRGGQGLWKVSGPGVVTG